MFKRFIIDNTFKKNITQRRLIFRSNWEVKFAHFLDNNNNVKYWKNDFLIKFKDRFIDQKIHKYYVDFYVEMMNNDILLIEIKPMDSLKRRVETKSVRYKVIHDSNYKKNLCKFESVNLLCKRNKWKFYLCEFKNNIFKFYVWNIIEKKPERVF